MHVVLTAGQADTLVLLTLESVRRLHAEQRMFEVRHVLDDVLPALALIASPAVRHMIAVTRADVGMGPADTRSAA
jgi:hypothetical protein